jgi:hypothetical protein
LDAQPGFALRIAASAVPAYAAMFRRQIRSPSNRATHYYHDRVIA